MLAAGPIHTDSSAKRTYFVSRSASEYSATVRIPSSRHVLRIRSAISPRLAITNLSIIRRRSGRQRINQEKRLTKFNRVAAVLKNLADDAGALSIDRIKNFHRLNDT